jgi:hypothetical protein
VDYGAALEMRFGATRRGFESRPLRHTALRVGRRTYSEKVYGAAVPGPTDRLANRQFRGRINRGSIDAYGPSTAAFPLAIQRNSPSRHDAWAYRSPRGVGPFAHELAVKASLLSSRGRARRGTSGALNLQSAPAGLNSHPRSPYSNATASSDVEDRVPRSGDSRTVSGPEGSSTKRTSSGAAERPGPSRSSRRARDNGGRRWVHGTSSSPTPR